jgi:hypothetical protein
LLLSLDDEELGLRTGGAYCRRGLRAGQCG